MKRILSILIFVICCSVSLAQQPQRQNRPDGGQRPNFDKYLQDRVSFVTKIMGLDAADSAKFVPLYKEMLKEKGDLMFKRPRQRIRPDKQYADSVYTIAAEGEITYKLEDAKIEKKYLEKFQKFLTPKEVFNWIQAEKLFISSFMHRGGPNQNNDRRPNNSSNQSKPQQRPEKTE